MKKEIWLRLGVTAEVDQELFLNNPEKALYKALEKGDVKLDGDSYSPEEILDDERYKWAKPAFLNDLTLNMDQEKKIFSKDIK